LRNDGRASGEPRGDLGGDETVVGKTEEDAPVEGGRLRERVIERENLRQALKQVKRNGGSPGVDGMTVEELPSYLRQHWPGIRQALLEGTYEPAPVRRVEIPKDGGGVRALGIPTVLDRFIQQALLQVLQTEWEGSFSEQSFGFRPGRSAHQAISCAQGYLRQGYSWVVDLDLEKFFDRVNHDKLMSRVRGRTQDRRVWRLIDRYLKAGVLVGGHYQPTSEGAPQGGPLSPLLANLLLDGLDKELERRGHRFVRYADDCNIYVRSVRAGQRVLASVTRYLEKELKLQVNVTKSAVERPWRRKFLGVGFTAFRPHRRRVAESAIERFKAEVRRLRGRTRGVNLSRVIAELRTYLMGWKGYFGYSETQSVFKELDSWTRRRLRCYLWKQGGRRRYRELRARGVSRELAWNTVKSAHGPWRISRSPALAFALPAEYFSSLGLPSLSRRSVTHA
jgi:RNA-directed DNA polymerase